MAVGKGDTILGTPHINIRNFCPQTSMGTHLRWHSLRDDILLL